MKLWIDDIELYCFPSGIVVDRVRARENQGRQRFYCRHSKIAVISVEKNSHPSASGQYFVGTCRRYSRPDPVKVKPFPLLPWPAIPVVDFLVLDAWTFPVLLPAQTRVAAPFDFHL